MTDTNNSFKAHIYALILAGGGGTRLWPKSTEKTPKQFLKLFNGRTLMQITSARINKFLSWDKIFVSTVSEAYKKEIIKEVPLINPKHIFVEPVRRDSAPAHGYGAINIYKKDPNAVIVNVAVDHFIRTDKQYEKTMMAASSVAFNGDYMVAIGIPPEYPHTGLGHLKIGKKWGVVMGKRVYIREAHVEKPPLELAKKFTESGKYYWNANHYVWRADTFLKALEKFAPDIYKGLEKIEKVLGTSKEEAVVKKEFEKMPKISVDYAVSEKAKNFLMLIADYSWTDIGDWNELWKNLPKDAMKNVIIDGEAQGGDIINIDTSDALIHKDGRLIAIIDMDNIVVVDTKEVLLICPKSRAQNVKKIVEILKSEGRKELL